MSANGSPAPVPSSLKQFFDLPRRSRALWYHLLLVFWICVAILFLMVVPYLYDQHNRTLYKQALASDNLVIQEFKSIYESSILEMCRTKNCDFYNILHSKKLIALDYASEMELTELPFSDFLRTVVVMLIPLIAVIALVSHYVSNIIARFLFIFLTISFDVVGVHLSSGLPHANTKFYYIFGLLISLLFSLCDLFHNVEVVDYLGKGGKYAAIALQERHKKWTSILGYCLAIISVIVGTISFNTIYYIRALFGEGFLTAPTIGIGVMCGLFVLVFIVGIVGRVRQILAEIENAIALLHD
jgi:hypothetical protein